MARTITIPINDASLSSSVIRNQLQLLEDEIANLTSGHTHDGIDSIQLAHSSLTGITATAHHDNSNDLSSAQKTGLTGTTDTTLHFHATDRARANHTGTQAASTISPQGSGSGLDSDTVDSNEAATLLARANHTGTQAASTISPQGAGSALDADKLDAQEGSFYQALANATGTLTVANGGTNQTTTGLAFGGKVIHYTGDGNDDRDIAHGLGRTPIYVLVCKTTAESQGPVFWTTGQPAGTSRAFNGGFLSNQIQAVDGTNVQMGSSSDVNQSSKEYDMLVI